MREGGLIALVSGGSRLELDATTGAVLAATTSGGHSVPISGGRFLGVELPAGPPQVEARETPERCAIHVGYGPNGPSAIWSSGVGDWLRLELSFEARGEPPLLGYGLDLPEGAVRGLTWLGPGPHRVWKNRQLGPRIDVWEKRAGGVTGAVWSYPELAGYHAPPYWATLETHEAPLTLSFEDAAPYLQVAPARFPEPERGRRPRGVYPPYPGTSLALLVTIPGMGTKFHLPRELGPSGQPETVDGSYTMTVHLYLGSLPPLDLAPSGGIE